jgi:putative two-component system response regulator
MGHKRPRACGMTQAVLVLDDEPIVLDMLTSALTRNGFKVLEARTAEEGRELFHTHASALCLAVVDIKLGGMNGVEFVEALPTLVPRIPILFITGLGDIEVEEKVPPNYPVLQKPFTVEEVLFQAVEAAVSSAPADTTSGTAG